MGLKYRVTADENHMGFTFNDAYWKFSSFGFGELGDEYVLMATLSAYPSREASQKTEASANVAMHGAPGFGIYGMDIFVKTDDAENAVELIKEIRNQEKQ